MFPLENLQQNKLNLQGNFDNSLVFFFNPCNGIFLQRHLEYMILTIFMLYQLAK